jgi:hypothetical protein
MHSGEKQHTGHKAKCADFGSVFKGFQEMLEMMSECCEDKIGVTDCCSRIGRTFDEMFGKSKEENDRERSKKREEADRKDG